MFHCALLRACRFGIAPAFLLVLALHSGARADTSALLMAPIHTSPVIATTPAADMWGTLPTANSPGWRASPVAAWTGQEMIVWAGYVGGAVKVVTTGTGGLYNPTTRTWRPMTPILGIGLPFPTSPLTANPKTVWIGSGLFIWDPAGRAAAIYHPSTNSWTMLSTPGPTTLYGTVVVWTGRDVLIWGAPRAAARFDPVSQTWTPIAATGAPSRRSPAAAVWTGTSLIIWGGADTTGKYFTDGAIYHPDTNRWTPIATAGAPSPRTGTTAVWTGTEMIVWGGRNPNGTRLLGDGAAYNPTTNTWRPLASQGAPSSRAYHTAVWTGAAMIVWGGTLGPRPTADGAAYTPATDTWHPISSIGAPSPRMNHAAVWTGHEMIVWGGANYQLDPLGDGASYVPRISDVHPERCFAATHFCIDNDTIWDYFKHRGGLPAFGYPVSRTFLFQGSPVQFFQRRIVQLGPAGQVGLVNMLDPGLLPYRVFNGAQMPGFDQSLVATAPDPADATATLAWVQAHAPNTFHGLPVDFAQTFLQTVPAATAFPNGGNPSLVPGIDLEMWGITTSEPAFDPNNRNVVYLRFQRGIMMYDTSCDCTQGILLGDYLKAILTGQNLPPDLALEARSSPLWAEYDPGRPNSVRDPSLLPNTDLTNAFSPE